MLKQQYIVFYFPLTPNIFRYYTPGPNKKSYYLNDSTQGKEKGGAMRSILVAAVAFMASLVFLTNFGGSWKDKDSTVSNETKGCQSSERPAGGMILSIHVEREQKEQAAKKPFLRSEIFDASENLESTEGLMEATGHLTIQTLEIKGGGPVLTQKKSNDDEEIVCIKKKLILYNRERIRDQLKKQALKLGLEPSLALSMAKVESGYDPNAVSPKGAIGVLQIMPELAWDFRISREMLFDPEINIRVGLSQIKSLLNRFDQDLELSLAAYNAGAGRVVKAGYKIPPIRETQAYVRKVKKTMENEV